MKTKAQLSHKWAIQLNNKDSEFNKHYVSRDEDTYTKSLYKAILYDTRDYAYADCMELGERPIKVTIIGRIRRIA